MAMDGIPIPVIRAYEFNTEYHSKTLSENWKFAMEMLSENGPKLSDNYSFCLQSGRATILEKMLDLITNKTYFKPKPGTGYMLDWKEAPHFLAKFLQQLETVFTGNKRMKIRRKILAPAAEVATSAAPTPTLPEPRKFWKSADIKTLHEHCEHAMMLLENSPAIISEEYKQCLQKGRDVIIKNMMEFTMDPAYFQRAPGSSEYLFEWLRAPEALETFLQHSEAVFTRDEELQIRKKGIVKTRSKTIAIPSAIAIPSREVLVALVEAPKPRQKCGILRTYAEVKSPFANNKLHLEMLKGKRILNEKWAEEGETYELSGEANAMLCMHLWSLMRYVGFSKSEKIWEGISRGWPECVLWKEGRYGTFWKIIDSNQQPLRIQARTYGMESIFDAYEDMERHFKEDSQHCLIPYNGGGRQSLPKS